MSLPVPWNVLQITSKTCKNCWKNCFCYLYVLVFDFELFLNLKLRCKVLDRWDILRRGSHWVPLSKYLKTCKKTNNYVCFVVWFWFFEFFVYRKKSYRQREDGCTKFSLAPGLGWPRCRMESPSRARRYDDPVENTLKTNVVYILCAKLLSFVLEILVFHFLIFL